MPVEFLHIATDYLITNELNCSDVSEAEAVALIAMVSDHVNSLVSLASKEFQKIITSKLRNASDNSPLGLLSKCSKLRSFF
jgi:hypothetical protein